jgi:hypothetical protein
MGWKSWLALFAALIGVTLAIGAAFSVPPDFEVSFVRDVPAKISPAKLSKAIYALSNWPNWFYSTSEAKAVNLYGQPYSLKDQSIAKGSLVELWIDPRKGKWKKFVLTVKITEFEPGKMIHFVVLKDTSNRLPKLFDRLEWQIDIITSPDGSTVLRGSATGHTAHWRSRLFGRLASRIMMNNVFYPNLLKLAELDDPLNVNPLPQVAQ